MLSTIDKIIKLSEKRIDYLHNVNNRDFYKGYKTYLDGIYDELEEAKVELKENNSVYLEDELGDIFWDYMCFLNSLEQSNMIDKNKVFERCYKKLSERIKADGENQDEGWNVIKAKQKEELKKEYNLKYKK